jgi:mRNA-degrading endonuclease RelE of RelBE toxin-antitoxin system
MNNTNGLREPYREATQNRAKGEHARRGKEGEKHQKEIQKPFPTSLKRNNKWRVHCSGYVLLVCREVERL